MERLEDGVYKRNGHANEAFQMEEVGRKGNDSTDVAKSKGSNAPEKVPEETSNPRAEWGGGLEFLMACIATSVGLGNVWRFPFTAYENGGGAFLIPYIIILVFVGKPFYFLEGLLGQFTNKSCAKTWSMAPAMKGLGYGQAFAATCVVSYYCALMALTLYYLAASFQSELPWSFCRDEWQGQCVDSVPKDPDESTTFVANGTVRSSAELYFRKIVLNEYDSIDDGIGLPSWQLTICLFLSWMAIFGVLFRGIKSTGKAAYFLAIFPYVVMIALLIRSVTLEGAGNGILFLVTPDWEKLWQPNVWYAAITQCFFSLSVCFGSIVSYSSYSNFEHNVSRDVLIVTTLDTFTSLIAGCTIFGILGNLAHEMGTSDISSVVRGGTGLAFISYPEALSRFTVVPQLFAVLFFVMMFVLGVGSAVALCGAVFSILCDHFPKVSHWKLVLLVSSMGFLVSLIYITPGGQWFITLVDYYGGTFVAIIVGLLEMVTIFWIYGVTNFLNDMEFMLGSRPSWYWRFCWAFITPVLMIVILVYTIVTYEPPTYDSAPFPAYAYVIGWLLLAVGVSLIVGFILQKLIANRSPSLIETVKAAFRPSEENWGPSDPKVRLKWKEFTADKNFRHRGGFVETFFR
ncbi:sodium-dependent nutrient amino acid transporter 1-like [Hylaeus anthracinus]|uniref:sodium-dependent nutrient amino acid transporter 1-like n=1 Tax=Hylaeus anthracinus TaxID=313031 RepID=UPI0023B9D01B|nr:sodium-dependent nutrient amino acid transporter 1-like [Hylaeus anthracinus]XP_054009975.1 sodium-dependent nutrient amino acid transporter 1-like [Hylaeus anthracinus]